MMDAIGSAQSPVVFIMLDARGDAENGSGGDGEDDGRWENHHDNDGPNAWGRGGRRFRGWPVILPIVLISLLLCCCAVRCIRRRRAQRLAASAAAANGGVQAGGCPVPVLQYRGSVQYNPTAPTVAMTPVNQPVVQSSGAVTAVYGSQPAVSAPIVYYHPSPVPPPPVTSQSIVYQPIPQSAPQALA